MSNIDVYTSIQTNYLSWLVILLSVCVVSYPHIPAGFITFFGLMIFAYVVHRGSHDFRNVFTILHHYHHENNNFFSHFSQIVLELLLGLTILPSYYYLGEEYVSLWTGVLFTLFYSSVHNINYGQLRVNDVHYLHHREIETNIGPDICDIAFGTKNPKNNEVENTWHYIPNVIVITILIMLIKGNETIQSGLLDIFFIFIALGTLLISISSIYLYFTYCPPCPPLEKVEPNLPLEKVEPNLPLEKVEPNLPLEKVEPNLPLEKVEPNISYPPLAEGTSLENVEIKSLAPPI